MRGLLGKKLSHSFSKEIHEKIDNIKYDLIEIDDLDPFFQEKKFKSLNVTIPYKQEVIKYLDNISDTAKQLQTVNTIVNKNGVLFGYNTDIDGLQFLINHYTIPIKNKVVGILGNGATKRTIEYVVNELGATKILIFARNPIEKEYHFTNKDKLKEIDILFNATPNGMFPHNNADLLINLDNIIKCSHLVDLIYNPLRTKLIIESEKRNIKAVNGLMMLVSQAVKANELFNSTTYKKSITLELYKEILLNSLNIVLIGMPMSGKSYYSKAISNLYNKSLIDIDSYIETTYNMDIPQIFSNFGEQTFREYESKSIAKLSKLHNQAISTGGGVVLNEYNIDSLKQNGLLLFLDMHIDELKKCNPKGRPLLQNPKNIELLYNQRYNLYNKYCDKRVIKRGFKRKDTLSKIEVKINEYINS